MRPSTPWIYALLAIATSGCEQISEQYAKIKEKITGESAAPPAPLPAGPAARPQRTPAGPQPAAPRSSGDQAPESPPPAPPPPPERPAALRDVPYDSPDTGTIAPGMGERDVYTLWGAPVAVRRQGEYTYLFFRNSCEYTCGTEDVVTLERGQVVDAVLRWPGHGYSGQSSSPPGTKPVPNVGGDTLTVKPRP